MKYLNETGNRYVPKFYAAWQENGFLCMVMEYADYGSVQDILTRHSNSNNNINNHSSSSNYNSNSNSNNKIPDHFIWHVLHDVSQGLAAMHAHDYVHLDIKPANLLLFADHTIKLSDFGMASKIGINREDKEGDSR